MTEAEYNRIADAIGEVRDRYVKQYWSKSMWQGIDEVSEVLSRLFYSYDPSFDKFNFYGKTKWRQINDILMEKNND